MGKLKSTWQGPAARPTPQTGITAQNYTDCAKAYLAGGEGYIIRALEGTDGALAKRLPPTEGPWIAWMIWFEEKGIATEVATERGMTTVPCSWPEDFDAEASASERTARLPSPPVRMADRAKVAQLIRKLGIHLEPAKADAA